MKKIYYIGYYSEKGNPNEFQIFPSTNNKMTYIIDVLKSEGWFVDVFSLGESKFTNFSKEQTVDDLQKITYVGTIGKSNLFFSVVSRLWLLLQMFYFLIFKIEKDSTVIVYHSYVLLKTIKFSRFFKKFCLVYEIEEIYKAVCSKSNKEINKEINDLQIADKYILVNDLIATKCSFNKKYVVCYGNYNRKKINLKDKIYSEEIKIVYAGVIGAEGSDVYLAIQSIEHLPYNYLLKIVGYGIPKNLKNLIKYIANVNNNFSCVRIEYEGLLFGNEYSDYLNKCNIGLSTRGLIDKYSDYTFPSKVLVYLANNLITVSSNISCIVNSKVASSIYFIEELTPKGIADTILKIDLKNVPNNLILDELQNDFKQNLNNLLLN